MCLSFCTFQVSTVIDGRCKIDCYTKRWIWEWNNAYKFYVRMRTLVVSKKLIVLTNESICPHNWLSTKWKYHEIVSSNEFMNKRFTFSFTMQNCWFASIIRCLLYLLLEKILFSRINLILLVPVQYLLVEIFFARGLFSETNLFFYWTWVSCGTDHSWSFLSIDFLFFSILNLYSNRQTGQF